MKKYLSILKQTRLFSGVGEEDISAMLTCLDAKLRRYQNGEYVLHQGESVHDIMVLVEGALHIQKDDYWGNSNIIRNIGVGEIFGEAYVAPDSGAALNNVIAVEDSAVIFFEAQKIMNKLFQSNVNSLLANLIKPSSRILHSSLDMALRSTDKKSASCCRLNW